MICLEGIWSVWTSYDARWRVKKSSPNPYSPVAESPVKDIYLHEGYAANAMITESTFPPIVSNHAQ